ncbi:hypothetical protein F53441_14108 [Fusarium austroafricanum]|uniref:2EXR domain-containing protein n=1 Tax=Fusarium austroafricanum TaxID=2364996 RepID=A0A8H4JHC2_9HYPO|nr:hypothetical protein F53441_14108 [Fusarium austroafricanum]
MEQPKTFSIFQNLPAELRLHIWKLALPNFSQPGLFPNGGKDCWFPQWLTPGNPNFDPGTNDNNFYLGFRPKLLTIEISLPTFFVNSEARGVTLSWIRENGVQMRFSQDQLRFTRCIDRRLDALYAPMNKGPGR